jgi:hypothetical protein
MLNLVADRTPVPQAQVKAETQAIAAAEPTMAPAQVAPAKPQCKEIEIETGVQRNFTGQMPLAPLRIITPSGGGYFLKLVDPKNDATRMTIYVRGGIVSDVDVPLGSYRIRYAHGATWCGDRTYFGPDTLYLSTENLFTFDQRVDEVSGYTLELLPRRDGNLPTQPIPPYQF